MNNVCSVTDLLERAARNYPHREAIFDLHRRMTYGELLQEAQQMAEVLVEMGIGQGDRIGLALPNWHEIVLLFFAASSVGAVLVPFNPAYKSGEVHHILQDSEAKVVFVSANFEDAGFEIVRNMVQEIITVRYKKDGYRSWEDLIKRAVPGPAAYSSVNSLPDDIFCVMYTSGTTGKPKGVMVTNRSVVSSGATIADTLCCNGEDVYLILAPIFHVFGLACNLISAIYSESRMVLVEKFQPELALQLIEREKVTIHHAVPSMLSKELSHPNFNVYDLSSLRAGMIGASSCPPETVRGVSEKMRMNLVISYGTTETITVTITDYDDSEKNIMETIGKAANGFEVRVMDDRAEPLPCGETGEIVCRGPGLMKGYYNMPEETEQAIDKNGWYYTGDLGFMNEEGYIRYVGRKKEVIIRGGYNIYPQEIELLLLTHPKVRECAVVGMPNPVLGEISVAVVRLKPGEVATKEEIIGFLEPQIARYKLPSDVKFIDSFPVTASGKIQKNKLKEDVFTSTQKLG